jgi:hypothetical protein
MQYLKLLILALTMTAGSQAMAIFEVRGNFAGAFVDPKDFNQYLKTRNVKETYIMGEIGGDVILNIPTTGLGLGARYQYSGLKLDGSIQPASSADMEWQLSRVMALGRYLFSFSALDIGPSLTVGITHQTQMRIKSSSGTLSHYDNADTGSFNIGLESRRKILIFTLGSEGGYQYYFINNVRGSGGTLAAPINLSGLYINGHIGISF